MYRQWSRVLYSTYGGDVRDWRRTPIQEHGGAVSEELQSEDDYDYEDENDYYDVDEHILRDPDDVFGSWRW